MSDNLDFGTGVIVDGVVIFRFTEGVCGLIAANLLLILPLIRHYISSAIPIFPPLAIGVPIVVLFARVSRSRFS